ncbi:uncharacterized protein LOC121996478 isoform X2 [Zingiber officinale]|uniref:dUTP diphosphatase n=1 Tax=Zingiber officinale TaxID=94328 RepID=A0A8J5L372_ZINOF|nr:uncharacterized protein LOC121996478 isoform X2 [Zingiber officinale]KAG6499736.1 hypothetical protein ZIOFF_039528 [Zingiber officinale]
MTTRADPPVATNSRTNTEGVSLFEDQVRNYRQNQRRRYMAGRALQRMARRITGREPYEYTLEQQLDPQVQLRQSMQERAALVPAEVLYHSRRDDAHHSVYVHRSEEAILVTTNQIDRSFIQEESFHQLQRSRMRFIHMGIIQVRVQILHRQEEGTLLLVVFRDNRWRGDQAIFAAMEIDLTHGSQLVYVIPDTMLTISDFYQNIQISILARGYEGWRNGEANILITRGMVGRLSNTPNVGFAYEVQNVVDYLASHGVRALPGRRYSTSEFMGQNWIIRPSTINIPLQPTEVTTNTLIDGRISMQFENYQTARTAMQPEYNNADQEIDNDEERMHLVAVLVSEQDHLVAEPEEVLYIKKGSITAQTPRRASKGAAGYDLAIDKDYVISPRGQELLSTGISIQVPEGTYARIAARSSYAFQGLIIGAGVVDSDFRGEVKIIVYNFSDNTLFLKAGEAVAQLILECYKTPMVMPVRELNMTSRGERGFVSTTPDKEQRIKIQKNEEMSYYKQGTKSSK